MTEEKKKEEKKASEVVSKKKTETNKIKVSPSKAHYACINALDLPISTKQSIEVARFIRGKNLKKIKDVLNRVLQKKIAVPYKRYNKDTPHRPGKIASGRYPQKTTTHFLTLLNSLESNAEEKGLNVDSLILSEVVANKGSNQWHYGRMKRRVMKKTNLRMKAIEND
jgi:large subunit ribosomal protein L22